jgi:hypothetical protein
MYEWYKVGSPEARLFDLKYTISNLGLSVNSTFRQSRVASSNSPKPFYDKARIMEYGIPVKISPIKGDVLAFNEDGTTIFTRKDIEIRYPGGKKVAGSYQKVFDSFFGKYFTQAFLRASGILNYLEDPKIYKKNLNAGSKSGRQQGIKTGYTWIVNAKIGVE